MSFLKSPLQSLGDTQRLRAGIVYLPQGLPVFREMTVRENLLLSAFTLGGRESKSRAEEMMVRFPELGKQRSMLAGKLSGGHKRLLSLAWALQFRPRLLLLDEPSAGLSGAAARGILEMICSLASDECAVVLAEQNVTAGLEIATRVVGLREGRVVGSWGTENAQEHLAEVFG